LTRQESQSAFGADELPASRFCSRAITERNDFFLIVRKDQKVDIGSFGWKGPRQ